MRRGYPLRMIKGDSNIPQRFWEVVWAMSLNHALALDKEGFIKSARQGEGLYKLETGKVISNN